MWNPSSGAAANESRKDVSLSDKNLKRSVSSGSESSDKSPQPQSGTVVGGTASADQKFIEQEGQSCDIDSGFLSGPQLSGYHDSEHDLAGGCSFEESSSKGSHGSQQSGRPPLEKQVTVVETNSAVLDSGYLETPSTDLEDASQEQSEHAQPVAGSIMHLREKVDSGLPEWFCNLSLKNSDQPLNNLSAPNAPTTAVPTAANTLAKNKANDKIPEERKKEPWEIYYRQNDDGETQLHIACITGYTEVVAALIRLAPHPCLLDIRNDEAQTALHLAVLVGHRDIVRMLLVAGAEPTMRDRNGNTPLHLACISGQMDCVQALTTPIAATEIQESNKTLLLPKNDKSTFRRCTQLPQDLEQRNYDGERCVHLAAQHSHIDVLRHLVWFGADINARELRSGKTPLHIAIETCNEVLANFLLEECQKLNLEAETYAGLTAYQLASANHHEQIANGLERHGAEPLTPPESDEESDDESDPQLYSRLGYFGSFNGAKAVNVA